ncbi:unnamed protein product [Closterium sp. NIES-64]|nr:unnamed protein product [Closterium sp. NIES-64]
MAAVRCRSAVSRGVCASGSLFDSQLSQRIASILCSASDLPPSVSSPHSEPLRVAGPAAGLSRFHSSSFVGVEPNTGSTPSSPAVAGDVAQSPLLPRLRSWFAAPDLTPPPFVGPTGGSEAGSGADGEARGDAQGRGEARMHGEGARGYGDQRLYGRDPRGFGRNFRPRPPVARPKLDLLDKYVHPSLLSAEERRQEELQGVKERFRVHEGDTGSSEVQIALLTSRIAYMAQHLQTHKKDLHSRRGLDGMLARRRKLLKYLRRKNWDSYCHVIAELGLRDRRKQSLPSGPSAHSPFALSAPSAQSSAPSVVVRHQSARMHRVRNSRAPRLLHLFTQCHAAPRLGALQPRAGAVTAADGNRPAEPLLVPPASRKAYGERHELVAGLRLRLAQAYLQQGRDAGEVLSVVEKAWEVFDAMAMDGDPVRAMCLHLMAACHARLGDPDECLSLVVQLSDPDECLSLVVQLSDPDECLSLVLQLGNPDECLSLLVQCEAALEAAKKLQSLMQEQDVAGTEQEIGSDGGESCGSRNGVAGVESGGGVGSRGGECGRVEGGDGEGEGGDAAAAAAAMAQGTADAIHMVGFAMHMLRADVSSARGDMDTALKAYRTALELQEEALGSEDPRVADALQHVGEECARHMRLGDAHAMGMRALQLHETHRRGLEERLGGEEGSGEGRGEEGGGVKGEELRERVREELEGRGREEVRREYEEAVMKEVADHRLLAAVFAGQGDASPAVHHLSAAAALLSSLLSSPSAPSALSPLDLASVHLATVDIILHSGLLQGEEGGEMGEGGEEGGRVNREEMGGEEAEIAEESDSREQQGEGLGVRLGGGGVKGSYEGGAEGGEVREEAMDMAVLALEALKQCVAVQGEELGKDHPAVARTYALAADVYWQIGQAEEAEKVSKRAIKVLAAMPAAHQRSEEAAAALAHVALHLKRTDRCGMAVPLLQRALGIRKEHPDHLLQAVGTATDLASLLLSLRRPNEALPILLSALPSLRSFLGPSHTASLPLLSLLSAAHSSLDQWSEAARVVGEMWEVVRREGMEEAMGGAMRGDEAAIGMWIPLADALGSEERFLLLQKAVEQAARGAEAGGESNGRGEVGEDAAAARARWLEVLREMTMINNG